MSDHPMIYSFIVFFFLMIRRPPRSTLFPTRRSSDLHERPIRQFNSTVSPQLEAVVSQMLAYEPDHRPQSAAELAALLGPRSEEHTSELQSRQYLVCRLLLEKKKNNKYYKINHSIYKY